jgi:hypothetical protein
METTTLIAIIVIALIVIGLAAWYYARQTRSQKLRERFGPEYHQTVRTLKSREAAEAELAAREKRVSRFNIVPLTSADCAKYQQSWLDVQSEFVDHPEDAVLNANRLVREVMEKRGYPVGGFDQAAADLSVDHPQVVENYRAAHRIAERSQRGEADTEELRKAIVYYRALFQDLLGNGVRNEERTATAERTRRAS